MVMKYTCYTCGHVSKDWQEIEACKNKGKKNKYKAGERIAFRRASTNEALEGTITEVAFKRRSHEVIYVLKGSFGFTSIGEEDIVGHKLAASA